MTKSLQINIGCMMLQLELNIDSLSQWFWQQAFIHSLSYLSGLAPASESKRFFPQTLFLTPFCFQPNSKSTSRSNDTRHEFSFHSFQKTGNCSGDYATTSLAKYISQTNKNPWKYLNKLPSLFPLSKREARQKVLVQDSISVYHPVCQCLLH